MISNEIPVKLTTDEASLIQSAINDWTNHDAFKDEQVAQVKALFAKVFGATPDKLGGLRFPDGMVMLIRDTEGPTEYYAILSDGADGWKGLHVKCEMEGMQQFFGNTTPFSEYMMIMQDSERYHMACMDEDDDDEEPCDSD
jgi:hypothetical protein